MEWSWRTVLIIIGLMVMAAILIDGFRRMRRARAEALRLDVTNEFNFPEDPHNPELPSGGFRVIGDREPGEGAAPLSKVQPDDFRPRFDDTPADDLAEREDSSAPYFADEDLSPARTVAAADKPTAERQVVESEPSATEQKPSVTEQKPSAAEHKPSDTEYKPRAEEPEAPAKSDSSSGWDLPSFSATDDEDTLVSWEDDVGPVRVVGKQADSAPVHSEPNKDSIQDFDIPASSLIPKARPVNLDEEFPVLLEVEELGDDDIQPAAEPVTGDLFGRNSMDAADEVADAEAEANDAEDPVHNDFIAEGEYPDEDDLQNEVSEVPPQSIVQPVNYASADAEKLADRPQPDMVLEIHCIARDELGFSGKDILYLFNSCDLRFGEMDIFHRFEQADGRGNIQFSVAQSYEPGIFVPAAMAQQHFRGLSFFMSLPGPSKAPEAYEAMSEMARVIARNLGADLIDGARSALTTQTIEHERQQIMEYERRQKLARKKQGLK